jgi:hypothetical protein
MVGIGDRDGEKVLGRDGKGTCKRWSNGAAIFRAGFEMKKIKYEKPVLYGLDKGSQDAEGAGMCNGGSAQMSSCSNGSAADNSCGGGTWAGASCGVGNMPYQFPSICGIGSGNTTGCGTGSSASGGCWPTGNST